MSTSSHHTTNSSGRIAKTSMGHSRWDVANNEAWGSGHTRAGELPPLTHEGHRWRTATYSFPMRGLRRCVPAVGQSGMRRRPVPVNTAKPSPPRVPVSRMYKTNSSTLTRAKSASGGAEGDALRSWFRLHMPSCGIDAVVDAKRAVASWKSEKRLNKRAPGRAAPGQDVSQDGSRPATASEAEDCPIWPLTLTLTLTPMAGWGGAHANGD